MLVGVVVTKIYDSVCLGTEVVVVCTVLDLVASMLLSL